MNATRLQPENKDPYRHQVETVEENREWAIKMIEANKLSPWKKEPNATNPDEETTYVMSTITGPAQVIKQADQEGKFTYTICGGEMKTFLRIQPNREYRNQHITTKSGIKIPAEEFLKSLIPNPVLEKKTAITSKKTRSKTLEKIYADYQPRPSEIIWGMTGKGFCTIYKAEKSGEYSVRLPEHGIKAFIDEHGEITIGSDDEKKHGKIVDEALQTFTTRAKPANEKASDAKLAPAIEEKTSGIRSLIARLLK